MYKHILASFFFFFVPLQKRHIHLKGWSMPSRQNRGCPSRQRTFLRAGIRSAWQNLTSPERPFLIIYGVEEAPSPSPSSYLLRKEHFHFCFWWYGNLTSRGLVCDCQKYCMPEKMYKLPEQDLNSTFLPCSVWISSGHEGGGCYIPLSHTLHCRGPNISLASSTKAN